MRGMWLDHTAYPLTMLLCALGMLGVMLFRFGARDVLFGVSLYYFYFAFGPVLNFLFGQPIYFGTVQDRIFEATVIFTLAITGLLLGALLIRPKFEFDMSRLLYHNRTYTALQLLLVSAILYTTIVLLWKGPVLIGQGKIDRIDLIGPTLHYNYMLIQFCVLAFYFFTKSSRVTRSLYLTDFLLFIVYCVVFSERDFFLILISIILHRLLIGELRITWKLVAFGVLLLCSGTYIFTQRAGADGVNIVSILNQGSLLFINTQIIDRTSDDLPFMYGATYANSVLNLLPSWLYQTGFSLSQWFKDLYGPGGISGYGFAIDAEAYLNFGYIGVPVLFAVLALLQRVLCNRIDRHPFFAYYSVFCAAFLMNSFRNDSLVLLQGLLFAAVLFAVVYLFSKPASPTKPSRF